MSLKQIKSLDRIAFLKIFVAEILINLEKEKPSKKAGIEILRKKIFNPIDSEKKLEKSINTYIFQKPIYPEEEKLKQIKHREKIFKPTLRARIIKFPYKKRVRSISQIQPSPPQINPFINKTQPSHPPIPSPVYFRTQGLASVKPEPQARPKEFILGNLESLLKDSSIQSLECPGPGKNILVKKYNKVNVTKLILSQEEITNIIEMFSQKARIPITGGILKAAVGDLVISAVISSFIGSRFIIDKITPYSLIER